MANKKTTSKKTTDSKAASSGTKKKTSSSAKKPANSSAAKKRTATASQAQKEQAAIKAQKAEQHRHQVWANILFGAVLLLFAIILITGQNVWLAMHNFLFGLFGICTVLVPLLLLYVAFKATLDPNFGKLRIKLLLGLLLICVLCGLAQIVLVGDFPGATWPERVQNLYHFDSSQPSGGLLSLVFGYVFLTAFGRTPTIVVFVIILLVLLLLMTGFTPVDAVRFVVNLFRKIGEQCIQIRERREEEMENAEEEEAEEEQEEPMPLHPVSSPKLKQKQPKWMDDTMSHPAISDEEFQSAVTKDLDFTLQDLPDKAEQSEKPTTPAENFLEVVKQSKEKAAEQNEKRKREKAEQLDALVARTMQKEEDSKEPEKEWDKNAENAENVNSFTDEVQAIEAAQKLELYKYPPVSLLKAPVNRRNNDLSEELKGNAELLVNTLKSFGVQTRVVDISRGPTVTRYELQPSAGVKISKITGLADDIALNLAAAGVRIEAPIPNKAAVGIEVPNKKTDIVSIREIIDSDAFKQAKSKLSVALGRDISGNEVVFDIAKMPHMLIAGATGSGKSVCINTLIVSLLYKSTPDEVRLLMVDPKVVELGIYNGIPHLLVPVVTDPHKAAGALGWAVTEMLNRYKLFADNQVRDLTGYNELAETKDDLNPLPQIVIIIDELADLMMAAPDEVEDAVCRLAQMARAAGMHLVIATQRPSVDVITGVIKANIPSRIAFSVSSQVDSRTIIDSGGAEKLLGRGDMLFAPVGVSKPTRVQCCYVSDKEVEAVVGFVKNAGTSDYDDKIMDEIEKQATQEKSKSKVGSDGGGFDDEDELMPQAIECVIEAGQASTSYLQRKLKVGYARAARLIDEMEQKGIVGPFEGSKPRQVLISRNQWIEMKMNRSATEEERAEAQQQSVQS